MKEREQQYGDALVSDLIGRTKPRDDLPLVTAEDTVESVINLMHERRAKEVKWGPAVPVCPRAQQLAGMASAVHHSASVEMGDVRWSVSISHASDARV